MSTKFFLNYLFYSSLFPIFCYKVSTLPRAEHIYHKVDVHTFAPLASPRESHLHVFQMVCERTKERRDRQDREEHTHHKL